MDDAPQKRRGRPKGAVAIPGKGAVMIPGDERAMLSAWMKEQIETIERAHQQRVEVLRTIGEHPSPVFAAMVKQHAYAGLPESLIAKLMCCSVSMLKTYYADELDLGKAELIHAVGMNMARIATSVTDPNNAKVGMDILNRRGGEEWKPPAQKIEMKAEDADPVIDSSKLTREERDQLRVMLTRIAEGGEGEPEEAPLIGEVSEEETSDGEENG